MSITCLNIKHELGNELKYFFLYIQNIPNVNSNISELSIADTLSRHILIKQTQHLQHLIPYKTKSNSKTKIIK